jgi:hypothetical protein
MADFGGIEPPKQGFEILVSKFGAGCRFRTGHLMITNQLLYQMS